MNIESFEIENWGCIKRVAVNGLPPTGVVIFHGPNRTGKSSIVYALRACLMDYPSTSRAQHILRWIPKVANGDRRPTVTVVFRAGGQTYRIKKTFGGGPSEFAVRTADAWRIETTSPADAHERVRNLFGGKDSDKGLHQLLWLTQGEFQLPEPREFDPDVQQALRTILGDLQTPLDSRFFQKLKERWNVWYTDPRRGTTGTPREKDNSPLAQNSRELATARNELAIVEQEFQEIERLIRQMRDLEIQRQDYLRQREKLMQEVQDLEQRWKQTEVRIREYQAAEQEYKAATQELEAARKELADRRKAEEQAEHDAQAVANARTAVDQAEQQLAAVQQRLNQVRDQLQETKAQRSAIQEREQELAQALRILDYMEELQRIQDTKAQAQEIAQRIEQLEKEQQQCPTLSPEALEAVKKSYNRLVTLRAELAAASLKLRLTPQPGTEAEVTLDAGHAQHIQGGGEAAELAFRRTAQVSIPGWGLIEVRRGTLAGQLDNLEQELRREEQAFADAVAPLRINPNDADALDQVLRRDAEWHMRKKELQNLKKELKKLAPAGLELLQQREIELRARLAAKKPGLAMDSRDKLHEHQRQTEKQRAELEQFITDLEAQNKTVEQQLAEAIQMVTQAREKLAAAEATASASRKHLEQLNSEERIRQRIEAAEAALVAAERRRTNAALTPEEETIEARLKSARDAVDALNSELRQVEAQYHRNRGRIEQTEGLHARRNQLAARVQMLQDAIERETLERDAINLLYRLFQECREQRQNQLLGSIRDRVLSWIRLLDIGRYGDLRFNEAFLPESLQSSDGTYEMALDYESTGAREQIAMMVRLAIGAALSKPEDPAVAVLDDPLTHADLRRLTNMRAILQSAAQGDPKLQPPAGPLQILIFTCHPEWFRSDHATVVNLEDPTILTRWPV
ncbi:MAG: SMC family ATPase [Gemmatales bacterium]|nr:SMC family ATPase [Gemmatales bacterium]